MKVQGWHIQDLLGFGLHRVGHSSVAAVGTGSLPFRDSLLVGHGDERCAMCGVDVGLRFSGWRGCRKQRSREQLGKVTAG